MDLQTALNRVDAPQAPGDICAATIRTHQNLGLFNRMLQAIADRATRLHQLEGR